MVGGDARDDDVPDSAALSRSSRSVPMKALLTFLLSTGSQRGFRLVLDIVPGLSPAEQGIRKA